MRLLGRGNLSVGRLFEAHVNALRLIARAGSPAQLAQAAEDAREGHLFGLWVTDAPGAPLRVAADGTLAGGKSPCSGAGQATRALVTAETPGGETVMFVVTLPAGTRADLTGWDTHGMRASLSGRMELTGLSAGAPIGQPGDYLRQHPISPPAPGAAPR